MSWLGSAALPWWAWVGAYLGGVFGTAYAVGRLEFDESFGTGLTLAWFWPLTWFIVLACTPGILVALGQKHRRGALPPGESK